MEAPLVPAYGESTLADVVPALAASLGIDGLSDALGLPASDRWVLLLVDGLGAHNLAAALEEAPFLASLLAQDAYVLEESRGLLDRLFDGRVAPLVAHFSQHGKLSKRDVAELRKLIEDLDDGH